MEDSAKDNKKIIQWLSPLMLLGGFSCVALSIYEREKLSSYGLLASIYFLGLILIAGFIAIGIYRINPEKSSFSGKFCGGHLKLRGSAVIFFVIMAIGFKFAPTTDSFAVTIFVHGPGGQHDLLLRGEGKVALDLREDRRYEAIDEKGAAHFLGIPAISRGKEAFISVEANGFELNGQNSIKLDSGSIYLPIRKKDGIFRGSVFSELGNEIYNAVINIEEFATETDENGQFVLKVPGERLRNKMRLYVKATEFIAQEHYVVPGSNEIQIRLQHK